MVSPPTSLRTAGANISLLSVLVRSGAHSLEIDTFTY